MKFHLLFDLNLKFPGKTRHHFLTNEIFNKFKSERGKIIGVKVKEK